MINYTREGNLGSQNTEDNSIFQPELSHFLRGSYRKIN